MLINNCLEPIQSELGKRSAYDPLYNPDKLFPIARKTNRQTIGIDDNNLPFYGFDLWNHYEVSWLDEKGKPIVALAEIVYRCDSPNLIEAKSMKLYFNSLNNTKFKDINQLTTIIKKDLSERVGSEVDVKITLINEVIEDKFHRGFTGNCIDQLDVEIISYTIEPAFLTTEDHIVEEVIYSDLLKSNCLVTGQPDWGSVQIIYKGKKINHTGLLKYIVSFRNHTEFNEQCIERVFIDIMRQCKPTELTVYGRYTRRGGMDINPYRSTKLGNHFEKNIRLCRQ
jgi:7-cyano-7-deazaguanine reductase